MFQSGKKARNIWRILCFVVQRPRINFSLFQFSLWVRWKNIRNSTKAIKSTKSLLKNHEPYPNFQHSLAANTSIFAPDLKHISFETHISPFKIWNPSLFAPDLKHRKSEKPVQYIWLTYQVPFPISYPSIFYILSAIFCLTY